MVRLFLIIFAITLHTSFLHAKDPSFKLTFGGKVGNIPITNLSENKDFKKDSLFIKLNFKF